jgi:hypothetical protein
MVLGVIGLSLNIFLLIFFDKQKISSEEGVHVVCVGVWHKSICDFLQW